MFKRKMILILAFMVLLSNMNLMLSASSRVHADAFEYVAQDSSFYLNDTPNTLIVSDATASDGSAAAKELAETNTWDFQLRMNQGVFTKDMNFVPTAPAPFAAGKAYVLYARVKADLIQPNSTATAFSVGVYSMTANNYPLPSVHIAANQLQDDVWMDIQVGAYYPSLTGWECVYLESANYVQDQIASISVDKFYYLEVADQEAPIINVAGATQNSLIAHAGGSVTIPVTTLNIEDHEVLDVVVKNSAGVVQSFNIEADAVNNNNSRIKVTVPALTTGGQYEVEVRYANAETGRTRFEVTTEPLIQIEEPLDTSVSYDGGEIITSATTLNIGEGEELDASILNHLGEDVTQSSGIVVNQNVVTNQAVELSIHIPAFTLGGAYTLQLNYGNASRNLNFVIEPTPVIEALSDQANPVSSVIGGEVIIPVNVQHIADMEQLEVVVMNAADESQSFATTGLAVSAGAAEIRIAVPAGTTAGLYTVAIGYETIPATTIQFAVSGSAYVQVGTPTTATIPSGGGVMGIPVTSANVANGTIIPIQIEDEWGTDVTSSIAASGNTIQDNQAAIELDIPETLAAGEYSVTLDMEGVAEHHTKFVKLGAPSIHVLDTIGGPVSYSGGKLVISLGTEQLEDGAELAVVIKDEAGVDQTALFGVDGLLVTANTANVVIDVPAMNQNEDQTFALHFQHDGIELASSSFLVIARPAQVTGDYTIEDSSLHLFNDANIVVDNSASDGSAASVGGDSTSKDIVYEAWDFGMLKYGAPYDVYFKLKVNQSGGSNGDAVKVGVYDTTQRIELITPVSVPLSETTDEQWQLVRVGTIHPNYGVNKLQFYVQGMGNSSVESISLDHVLLKNVVPHVIQNDQFILAASAVNGPDGLTPDNSAVKVTNGTVAGVNINDPAIQIPIDGSELVTGNYNLMLLVSPDRVTGTNWDDITGEVMGYSLHNLTTNETIRPKTMLSTSNSPFNMKIEYFGALVMPVAINPEHDYELNIYSSENVANFPSFRVDSATFTRVLPETHYDANHYDDVYPYKISPGNADGIHDFATVYYSVHGLYQPGKTVDVTVYSANGNQVKKLVDDREDWTYANTVWDGTNDQGAIVPNGLYTIEVKRSDGFVFMYHNVEVITGVELTKATVNPALDHFPKGVWFEAGNIPYIEADAEAYLDRTFKDISEAGLDTAYLANWHGKPDIYDITLEKAAEYGIELIGLPNSHDLFKFWDGNFFNTEGLYSNDEIAMYDALAERTALALKEEHADQLAGYLLFDEPRSLYVVNTERFRDNLSLMVQMLESIDPTRFTVIDYTMPEDAEYFYPSNQTQAISLDLYPAVNHYATPGNFKHIGTYPNATFEESLDASTLQVRKDLTNDAPIWMILQAHGETGGLPREPIASELRAMTYESLGRGARGFTYFLYQSTVVWRGMVDYDYTRRPHYYNIKKLMEEVEVLKPVIMDMSRVANIATTTGGGGGATVTPYDPGYASADITTHESVSSTDKYLVVVNHDALASSDVTITIDRDKLGMNLSAIKVINKEDGSESPVSFTTTEDAYIISSFGFEAGDGQLFRLVKQAAQTVKTLQDQQFGVWGAGSTRGNADLTATDGTTAMKTIGDSNGPMDFYSYVSAADLELNETYDVFARVKINYKTALLADLQNGPSFPKPEGDAFEVGMKFGTGGIIVAPTTISGASMENMLWTNVKIGEFTATEAELATDAAYVYVSPANNKTNIESIYVDHFYYVQATEDVPVDPIDPVDPVDPVDPIDQAGSGENGTVQDKGLHHVSLTAKALMELMSKAQVDASGDYQIVLDYTGLKDMTTLRLQLSSLLTWMEQEDKPVKLTISTSFGTLSIDKELLQLLQGETGDLLTIQLRKGSLEFELLANDKPIQSWDANYAVKGELPYSLKEGQRSEYVVVTRKDKNGTTSVVPQSGYADGVASFWTSRAGTYEVKYNEKSFSDLSGHWSEAAVKAMAAREIIKGKGNGLFQPDAAMTRADYVIMLLRMLGIRGDATESFIDVQENDYYAKEVGLAQSLGIIKGDDKQAFRPRAVITRQEMFTITNRALALTNKLGQDSEPAQTTMFLDADKIAPYAIDSIASLSSMGLIQGYKNRIQPQEGATRGQAAQFLANLAEVLQSNQHLE
ncbi:S-layer homology domain-containing protein [Paenibacillus sp. strain BS8-2]